MVVEINIQNESFLSEVKHVGYLVKKRVLVRTSPPKWSPTSLFDDFLI